MKLTLLTCKMGKVILILQNNLSAIETLNGTLRPRAIWGDLAYTPVLDVWSFRTFPLLPVVCVLCLVHLKFICWSPNTQYLRMWLYLKIGAWKRYEVKMGLLGWALSNIPLSLWEGRLGHRETPGMHTQRKGQGEDTTGRQPCASQGERLEKKINLWHLELGPRASKL